MKIVTVKKIAIWTFSIFLILTALVAYGLHSLGLLSPSINLVVNTFTKNEKFPFGEYKRVEIPKRIFIKRQVALQFIIEFINEPSFFNAVSRVKEVPCNMKITGYKIHNNQRILFYSRQVSCLDIAELDMTRYASEFELDNTKNTAVAIKLEYLDLDSGDYIFEFSDEGSEKNKGFKTFVEVIFHVSK
ncbi:Uncharacterised protein [Kingella potus]|uniref:Uncharacterized protein n=1 Tax=Kingella potus TaxID=265175 RepID=A0A377QZQ2_9NEIS|nr:hypothetical protein [Kingella potus]UOP01422.1 hypothetical protein LVJ84_04205 [Kingella potus]STR00255.1 Uncharacterised protein [Kingella potus]